MRLPDFIIGGAPRSGTTWLYWLLDRHPNIYMARPVAPEPKFFLDAAVYEKGLRFYSDTWFKGADDASIAGEKSTNYLESAAAAERMSRDIPNVRLVFVLREPAERAFSNYLWSRMNGFETDEFARALELEQEREQALPERLKVARPFSYFTRGLYAELLARYFERFPREHLLVLRFEDIGATPERVAVRLHEFLGVTPRPGDAAHLDVINPSERSDVVLDDRLRRALRARYAEPNRRLAAMLGPSFELWTE